ncbi:hypothetical protein JCM3774_002250 [Rhodotorula dairenensis]
MPNPEKAREILTEIHALVKPVMKAHKWYLPQLCEFFPRNECLLGVNWNAGDKICIRLRPSYDKNSFLSMEDSLIPTMLHELTHNYRGPHDDKFYKFLEGLTDEYYTWRRQRFLAFSDPGNVLGAGRPRGGPVSVREARVKHQQNMQALKNVLGRGGRLGGSGPAKLSPAAIAEAAERRIRRATTGCGGHGANDQSPAIAAEVERAARASIYIDLTTESDDSDESDVEVVSGPVKKEHTASPSASPVVGRSVSPADSEATLASTSKGQKRRHGRGPDANFDGGESSDSDIEIVSEKPATTKTKAPSMPRHRQGPRQAVTPTPKARRRPVRVAPPSPKKWACSDCTLINEATTTTCAACGASLAPIRPLKASLALFEGDGWVCPNPRSDYDPTDKCGTINEHSKWMCSKCHFIKQESARG